MPTRYDLRLRIFYTYGQPTSLGRHLVRMQPLDLPGRQRVILRHLSVTPEPRERVEGRDFFGNAIEELGFDTVASGIEFQLSARVERRSQRPGLDLSTTRERLAQDIAQVRSLDGDAPHHFLGRSARLRPHSEITEYAQGLVTPAMTVQECVTAVGLALHEDMTFLPGATDADTPALSAFRQRKGVCQDYAHIMIAALRGIGIPAGYVSGFLRTLPPEGQPRLEGADAMHAWVRAWCGREVGWIEYDPTNAMTAGEDHIMVAYGRDYSDVSPVRGVTRTAGFAGTGHSVDMVELKPGRG